MWQKNETCYKQAKLFKKYREKLNVGYLRIMITPALVKNNKKQWNTTVDVSVQTVPLPSHLLKDSMTFLFKCNIFFCCYLKEGFLLLLQKNNLAIHRPIYYICRWWCAESRNSSSTEKQRYLKNLQYREKERIQNASTWVKYYSFILQIQTGWTSIFDTVDVCSHQLVMSPPIRSQGNTIFLGTKCCISSSYTEVHALM